MNKSIKQLVKKFEFVQKINETCLNTLSSPMKNSSSARIQNNIEITKLKHSILNLHRLKLQS